MTSSFTFDSVLEQIESAAFALGHRLHSDSRLRIEVLDIFLEVVTRCPGISQESLLWNSFRRAVTRWDFIPVRMFETAVEDAEAALMSPVSSFRSGRKPSREWMMCWLLFCALKFASRSSNYVRPVDYTVDVEATVDSLKDVNGSVR